MCPAREHTTHKVILAKGAEADSLCISAAFEHSMFAYVQPSMLLSFRIIDRDLVQCTSSPQRAKGQVCKQ